MNSRMFLVLLALAFSLNSCITEFKADLPITDSQLLIVEGSISEYSESIFYLGESFALDANDAWTGHYGYNATLYVIGSNGYKSKPSVDLKNGSYSISIGSLDDNVEYGLEIIYNGETYRSSMSKPLHTPAIDSITWVQPEDFGPVTFQVSTHDDKNEAKFFIWDYVENWESPAYYLTTVFYDPNKNTYYTDFSAPNYYCWKSMKSNKFLIGSTESLKENRLLKKPFYDCFVLSDRFSVLYSITVNQKAISKAAFEYYQNKILLNNQMGGLFTPQPSEIGGNIVCITNPAKKVMGYIETVKNVTQKRIFITAGEVSFRNMFAYCNEMLHDEVLAYLAENRLTLAKYYELGFRPSGEMDWSRYPAVVPLNWSEETCTNCLRNGGSKNKPDFWPNNHK